MNRRIAVSLRKRGYGNFSNKLAFFPLLRGSGTFTLLYLMWDISEGKYYC
jgi:hypothetical protein